MLMFANFIIWGLIVYVYENGFQCQTEDLCFNQTFVFYICRVSKDLGV